MIHAVYGYLFDYVLWWVIFLSLVVHAWCFFKFFPRRQRRKTGLLIGNLLIFACLADCAALTGETYFRFISIEMDPFGMTFPARRWLVLYGNLNSSDCRDAEWSARKVPGARRIAFVGDSFVYGWGVNERKDRFPDLVGVELNRRSPGSVEIMNVAKPGADTGEQVEFLRRLLVEYEVDEVVLCYVPNDIERILPITNDFNPTLPPPTSRFFNLHGSALLEQIYYRVYVPRALTVTAFHDWLADGYADARTWRRQQERLREMIELCRRQRVRFRVVLLPFLRWGGQRFDPDGIHAQLTRFFTTEGVAVVDLLPVFAKHDPSDLVLSAQDAHPNELGHRLVAEAILRELTEHP